MARRLSSETLITLKDGMDTAQQAIQNYDLAAAERALAALTEAVKKAKAEDKIGQAKEFALATFKTIANDIISPEHKKAQQGEWDARLPHPFGSSLHYQSGPGERFWYYLTPSALAPYEIKVTVEMAEAKDHDRDNQNYRGR